MKNEESGAGDSQAKHVGADLTVLVTTGVDVYADPAGKTTQVLWSVDPTHVDAFEDIQYRAAIYTASKEVLSLFDLGIQGLGYIVKLLSYEGEEFEIFDALEGKWKSPSIIKEIPPVSSGGGEWLIKYKLDNDEGDTHHCILTLTTERRKSLDEKESAAGILTHDTVPRDIRTGGN